MNVDMDIIDKIRSKFSYRVTRPLVYDEAMRSAYSTTSVAGGTLRGKTAVVTGATGGIGRATAQRLLNEGCNVMLAGRNEPKLKESLSELRADKGTRLDYMVIDSLDPESLRDKVKTAFENHRIDIWVNSAGIIKRTDWDRKFRDIGADTYFEVVDTNLKSNMLLIPCVADEMVARGIDGTIITVSSFCGFINHFGHTPYGISKNGLIEFTRGMAEKYKGKVGILSVAPGTVATRMGGRGYGSNISGSSSFTHRIGIPEETASVIAFLASPAGRRFNGQAVLASAGERA